LTGRVLILRPEPGASETAARAEAMGLEPVVRPLFELVPVPWDVLDPRRHDATFFTSANAARLGGEGLGAVAALPAYAVGESTAAALEAAGFANIRTGSADGASLVAAAARAGVRRALHLCGRDNILLRHPDVIVEQRIVYAADEVAGPVEVPRGAVVLLHSPRAAAAFASRCVERSAVRLAAISPAVAHAAGEGWGAKVTARWPRDEALLEVARALCQSGAPDAAGAGS
jgi:uroporphyrinogen-III synthase